MNLTSPSQVKAWCIENGFHPNKVMGQNFLVDRNVLEAIVDAGLEGVDVVPPSVLEIGPGLGVMTEEMLRRGCRDFLLVGAAGGRLDHTLANLSLLLMLDDAGVRAVLADDSSLTRVVSREEVRIEDEWSFFSLLAAGGDASGVTVTGARYTLEDAALTSAFPLGVSNEVLPGQTAAVRVGRGRLFLICDW